MILMLDLNFVFPIAAQTLDNTDGEIITPEDEGLLNAEPRVVGGIPATVGQFPYQVMLLRSN